MMHMQGLRQKVLLLSSRFEHVSKMIAELDCLAAFAECAVEYRYVCPNVTPNDVLVINEGRHGYD
jgi:DNA mismatch repair ATPase MutS